MYSSYKTSTLFYVIFSSIMSLINNYTFLDIIYILFNNLYKYYKKYEFKVVGGIIYEKKLIINNSKFLNNDKYINLCLKFNSNSNRK